MENLNLNNSNQIENQVSNIEVLNISEIYNLYHSRLLNFIKLEGCNPFDAEEITNDIFIKLYKNQTFDSSKGVKLYTYLCHLAKNLKIDYYRKNKNDRNTDKVENFVNAEGECFYQIEDSNKLETILEKKEINEHIEKAVSKISGNAVAMHRLLNQGFTYEEISETLNVPIGTVKCYLNRRQYVAQQELKRVGLISKNVKDLVKH